MNATSLEASSEAATRKLIVEADATLDISRLDTAATALSASLRDGFLATMTPLIGALPETSGETAGVVRALMERIARLEADMLVLKSALANNNRFVMSEARQYADPVAALEMAAAREAPNGEGPRLERLVVPLGPEVLGHGWHGVDKLPDGSFWRWSGPGRRSTLLLPSLGVGTHSLEWSFTVIDRSVLAEFDVSINGMRVPTPEITWTGEVNGVVRLQAQVPTDYKSSHLFVALDLAGTRRPADVGTHSDTRQLGMGVSRIVISRG